jgi:lipopolysaccharide/colanic/teichoic acid biosynthesis glycosyltransferase
MIRFFDLFFSLLGLILLLPVFMIISLFILIDSRGGIFYFQTRVGKNNKDFRLIKFRTMHSGSEKKGSLTIGASDNRITRTGRFLRKYKLDELPQLFNVFIGEMSLVGPRPEVRQYVERYTSEQLKVLDIRPGITDYASLEYFSENELLGRSADPESVYINEIMPAKLELNRRYIENPDLKNYFSILIKTIKRLLN